MKQKTLFLDNRRLFYERFDMQEWGGYFDPGSRLSTQIIRSLLYEYLEGPKVFLDVGGGTAIFVETWGKNPLLVCAGKYLAGRFGIAKYGTKYEHPIMTTDIKRMRRVFSEVHLEFPEFILFKKMATTIFRWKKNLKFITNTLVKMDDFVTRRFPSLNKYGYYCVIELVKGDDKELTARYR